MVGVLIELKDLKWALRVFVVGFYSLGLYLEIVHQHKFFHYLVKDHSTSTLVITFLSAITFLPFIVPKPKRKIEGGGEVVMKKFHAIIVLILSILVVLVVALANYHEETTTWLNNIGGGVGASIVAGFSGFNNALRAYEPYQVMLGSIAGGVFLAWMIFFIAAPKIKDKLHPAPLGTTPYQAEPEPAPAVKIRPKPVAAAPPPPQEETSNE